MSAPLTSAEVIALTKDHNYGTWRKQKLWNPGHLVSADGCYFTDGNGKRFLDFASQLICMNLGHNNPAVIKAIQDQAATLAYAAPFYATTARAELSKLLLEVLPEGLTKFFFTTSGTDANEAAFKIARMYTGKTKIITRYRSYHGSTSTSIAATGDPRRWPIEPGGKGGGVIFSPEVNCYNCPIKHTYPGCGIACADYLEHMIANEGDVAAVIMEPVVGTNGVLVPPPEYFPKIRRICDDHGVLLIADEVMTGWGRTGKWFAVDHWGVKPDILTTAKGITSAYVPLGLCATTQKIADHFIDNYFAHGHTYEAHPITLGPAVATIHEMQRLDLVARSARVGHLPRRKTHRPQAQTPLHRRRPRPRPLLGGRTRQRPEEEEPLQLLAGQARRQAHGHRPGRRKDGSQRRRRHVMDEPLRLRAPTHRRQSPDRRSRRRIRRSPHPRRRPPQHRSPRPPNRPVETSLCDCATVRQALEVSRCAFRLWCTSCREDPLQVPSPLLA